MSQLFPNIAREFVASHKGTHIPDMLSATSGVEAVWRCERCTHVARGQSVADRVRVGCKQCAGRILQPESSAGMVEAFRLRWDWARNDKSPWEYSPGSGQKAHLLCADGHSHRSQIAAAVKGSGCPHCRRRSSKAQEELAVALRDVLDDVRVEAILPIQIAVRHPTLSLDILAGLGAYRIGIEYDGWYRHHWDDAMRLDRRKSRLIVDGDAVDVLVRVREHPLALLDMDDRRIVEIHHRHPYSGPQSAREQALGDTAAKIFAELTRRLREDPAGNPEPCGEAT
ncbi:zinc-ribbon domain-containing protein [Arthrobacter halodurans]|uniref:Zinc-ribbon domain-containing protein n=1 Tax=Arthrobacter halodurans TaxID=516699 RepID=A0ABV4UPX1_9MICC